MKHRCSRRIYEFFLIMWISLFVGCEDGQSKGGTKMIKLPAPKLKGTMSVEEAIYKRRSRRSYAELPLSLEELGQVLFAAYGITDTIRGLRASPSAGATYPMEIYLVAGEVENLEKGLYHYIPEKHSIELVKPGDIREPLRRASLGQSMITEAPVSVIIAAESKRTTSVYGERGTRYIDMEVGHIGQNIYLQCEALGLGTVAIGAFKDEQVKNVLGIKEMPLYIMPIGRQVK